MNDQLPPELVGTDLRLLTATTRPPSSLLQKEGWRDFVNHQRIEPPVRLDESILQMWSKEKVARYKAIRKRYHAALPPLATAALSKISDAVVRMSLTALDMPPGVRPGALINGLPTLGKSTVLLEAGRIYERRMRQRLGLPEDADLDTEYIPVVYTTLSAEETCKGLSTSLLNFYGETHSANWSESKLSNELARQAARSGTSLILIDDIHFLKAKVKQGMAVNTHLKSLMSRINATFAYAGVHVDRTGLLFEGQLEANAQAAQTQRRFKRFDMETFPGDLDELKTVLAGLEKQLILLKARPGDLQGLAQYVQDRTDGYMGPIAALVREGAALAIDGGQERLSKSLLDAVTLDHASEKRFEQLNPSQESGADLKTLPSVS